MKLGALALSVCVLSACSQAVAPPDEPTPVLPDAEAPTAFTRAYGLTESPDGAVRVFAKEDGDITNLFEMRKQGDGGWSAPEKLDFPHRIKLTNPSFSFADGMLYYASDEEVFDRGQRDANIWRVAVDGDGWGTPEPLPEAINTGADELNPAMDKEGRLYFTSNGYDSVGGHDIFEATLDEETGEWTISMMPEGFNHIRAEAHIAVTPDGQRIFFYSHRKPKLGIVDIWTATRDEAGIWQMPQNLGAPVNTPGIDFGAGVSADGSTFFFSREGELMMISMKAALKGVGTVEAGS
ncbi:glycoside hydrolase [Henriciella aquimarina]|uniref:glycoside hydrolase n=1 Tax=Henriciella aquimarina TaxID=545261 RepID=UPI000A0314A4|nr:glycoside hydrolase [Henriciella aquimarina]